MKTQHEVNIILVFTYFLDVKTVNTLIPSDVRIMYHKNDFLSHLRNGLKVKVHNNQTKTLQNLCPS